MIQENVEKESPVKAKVKVQVPSDKVNEHLESYYSQLANKVHIDGFRPGKVPREVLKKRYGEEASSSISERLVSESLIETVRKHDLHVILPPQLKAVDPVKENTNFSFEAELDLKPEVPEVKCAELEFEAPEASEEVTDEKVREQLEQIRDRSAEFVTLFEDRPVRGDDAVVVSFTGKLDGEVQQKASADNHQLTLGRGEVHPDFEKAVTGLKKGEKTQFQAHFPEDHQAEEFRGKTVEFDLELTDIKEKRLPEMTDEWAKSIGNEITDLESLKHRIKEELQQQAEQNHKQEIKKRLGDALIEKYPFEINQRQKQMTAENILRDSIQRMMRMGMTQDNIKQQQKEMMEEALKAAERQIRLAYLLEKIAQQQGFDVTPEDIEKRFEKIAQASNASVDDVRAYYNEKKEDENASRLDGLKMEILEEKSLDYALSQATMKAKGSL